MCRKQKIENKNTSPYTCTLLDEHYMVYFYGHKKTQTISGENKCGVVF